MDFLILILRVSASPEALKAGVVRIPLRQIPFLEMESTTVLTGEERAECTSLIKYTSKSMGTAAALKTSSTEATSSGPTPSPGMRVAVTLSSGLLAIMDLLTKALLDKRDRESPNIFSCRSESSNI